MDENEIKKKKEAQRRLRGDYDEQNGDAVHSDEVYS